MQSEVEDTLSIVLQPGKSVRFVIRRKDHFRCFTRRLYPRGCLSRVQPGSSSQRQEEPSVGSSLTINTPLLNNPYRKGSAFPADENSRSVGFFPPAFKRSKSGLNEHINSTKASESPGTEYVHPKYKYVKGGLSLPITYPATDTQLRLTYMTVLSM